MTWQFSISTIRTRKCGVEIFKIFHCALILLLIGLWTNECQAEYFSSTDSVQVLAVAEKDLLQWYQDFIAAQRADFSLYRNFIKQIKEEHEVATEDPESFFGNPINAFKLIKRTVVDWARITGYIQNHPRLQALNANLSELSEDVSFPGTDELRGAAKGLGRLQTMYNLSSIDLADGVINDINYGSELSIRECFEIGCNLFEAKEFPLALSWLQLVLKFMSFQGASNDTSTNDLESGELLEEDKILQGNGIDEGEVVAKQLDHEGDDENEYNYANEDQDEDGYYDEELDVDHYYDEEDLIYEKRYGVFAPLVLYDIDEFESNLAIQEELDDTFESSGLANNADMDFDSAVTDDENSGINFAENSSSNNLTRENDPAVQKILLETLEYLALASYELGQQEAVSAYIDEILKLSPEHFFKDLEIYMKHKKALNLKYSDNLSDLQRNHWYSNYTRLCQGKRVPQRELRKLKCTLDTQNQPLFVLAPLRKEILHTDPEIVMYHGLLTDTHIDDILDEAENGMQRSRVGGLTASLVRDVRVSQQAWLPYNSTTMKYIYRTVSAISGLDLTNAETMQVANYGIGGQYDPHYDYFVREDPNSQWIGNRIATHLFFTSDVEQGGYTVFPYLNVYAKPVKGSMIMWYNLHRSLDRDLRTLHAGCPVIKGTKRICNVWVHSGYQEFRRPCDVVRDNYKSSHFGA
ncbi:unnamed protein product [Ceratitis capitata]|uniref:procollagen-proline 4-dioxygenase n=1 Tax=Ceratitis capitata TaxID=7213 RepID=A0A811TZK8_CERCA|nr:unnamed protein product [Ceratitis capitata]